MRKCIKCKEDKTDDCYTLNYNKKLKKHYTRGECKVCRNKKIKEKLAAKRKDPLYYVYYLPHENYCGITVDIDMRMKDHLRTRSDRKRSRPKNVDDYRVLFISKDKTEAHYHEALFQSVLAMDGLRF